MIGTLINVILLVTISHPLIQYERSRLATGGTPLLQIVWFYVAFLSFLYFRNVVNHLFNSALMLTCMNYFAGEKQYLTKARQQQRECAWRIFKWSSFFSFFGVYYRLYSGLLAYKGNRKMLGGSYFHYAAMLAGNVIVNEKLSSLKALKRSGQLVTKTWGEPPMRIGFNMSYILVWYFIAACLPAMLAIVLTQKLYWPVYVCLGLSSILLYLYSVLHKVINQILHHILYEYASKGVVTPPFSEDTIKKALTVVILEDDS